jgi:hypothetical protein
MNTLAMLLADKGDTAKLLNCFAKRFNHTSGECDQLNCGPDCSGKKDEARKVDALAK